MKKGSIPLSVGLLGVLMGAWAVQAELTTTEVPVRSVDNIPPAPVTNLTAIDTPEDTGSSITLAWELSADDHRVLSAFGDVVVTQSGLRGYRIYRVNADNDTEDLIATLPTGATAYVDLTPAKDVTYIYAVRPFDSDNETDYAVEIGSAADLARIASALDNTYVPPVEPVGTDGLPVLGWFSKQGDRVGFDDFFLFADHFGLGTGEGSFDPIYDLVPNGKIDFDDFFLFADNFGKAIANADVVRGG
ncbi:MAG: fibronectin type III domain-containing protein [Candidatus Latescibacteria bacterium]|nr:fibronectin type III domain-containing protein [Candidatus Latescibacterota bacterium]